MIPQCLSSWAVPVYNSDFQAHYFSDCYFYLIYYLLLILLLLFQDLFSSFSQENKDLVPLCPWTSSFHVVKISNCCCSSSAKIRAADFPEPFSTISASEHFHQQQWQTESSYSHSEFGSFLSSKRQINHFYTSVKSHQSWCTCEKLRSEKSWKFLSWLKWEHKNVIFIIHKCWCCLTETLLVRAKSLRMETSSTNNKPQTSASRNWIKLNSEAETF